MKRDIQITLGVRSGAAGEGARVEFVMPGCAGAERRPPARLLTGGASVVPPSGGDFAKRQERAAGSGSIAGSGGMRRAPKGGGARASGDGTFERPIPSFPLSNPKPPLPGVPPPPRRTAQRGEVGVAECGSVVDLRAGSSVTGAISEMKSLDEHSRQRMGVKQSAARPPGLRERERERSS